MTMLSITYYHHHESNNLDALNYEDTYKDAESEHECYLCIIKLDQNSTIEIDKITVFNSEKLFQTFNLLQTPIKNYILTNLGRDPPQV